jgi:ferredoxin
LDNDLISIRCRQSAKGIPVGKCVNHPDQETNFSCMKYNIYLCGECLECRDPELYCKFRPSCPIWFITKRKQKWEAEDRPPAASAARHRVAFSIQGKQIQVARGTTLLEAARLAGVHLNASCNGKGSCGKCKLVLESGDLEAPTTALLSEGEKARGYILACQSKVQGDVVARIPEEALQRRLKIAGMGLIFFSRSLGIISDCTPSTSSLTMM